MEADTVANDALQRRDWPALVSRLEQLELEAASSVAPYAHYAALILSYLIVNDLDSARFTWRRAPQASRSLPDAQGAWAVATRVWENKYADVYEALAPLCSSSTPAVSALAAALLEAHRERMLALVARGFSSVTLEQLCALAGLQRDEAVAVAASKGWPIDEAASVVAVVASGGPSSSSSLSRPLPPLQSSLTSFGNLAEFTLKLDS
eukprot:m51a1_g1777 putative cop9 signalosome complex subunit 8 (207) ;mRNA; f:336609-337547